MLAIRQAQAAERQADAIASLVRRLDRIEAHLGIEPEPEDEPDTSAEVASDTDTASASDGDSEPENTPPSPAATEPEGTPLSALLAHGLSADTGSMLAAAGLRTVEALAGHNQASLVALPGIGKARAREIQAALHSYQGG